MHNKPQHDAAQNRHLALKTGRFGQIGAGPKFLMAGFGALILGECYVGLISDILPSTTLAFAAPTYCPICASNASSSPHGSDHQERRSRHTLGQSDPSASASSLSPALGVSLPNDQLTREGRRGFAAQAVSIAKARLAKKEDVRLQPNLPCGQFAVLPERSIRIPLEARSISC